MENSTHTTHNGTIVTPLIYYIDYKKKYREKTLTVLNKKSYLNLKETSTVYCLSFSSLAKNVN